MLISDEDLMKLTASDHHPARSIFFCAVGAFSSSAFFAVVAIADGAPYSGSELVTMLLTTTSLVVAMLAGFIWRRLSLREPRP